MRLYSTARGLKRLAAATLLAGSAALTPYLAHSVPRALANDVPCIKGYNLIAAKGITVNENGTYKQAGVVALCGVEYGNVFIRYGEWVTTNQLPSYPTVSLYIGTSNNQSDDRTGGIDTNFATTIFSGSYMT